MHVFPRGIAFGDGVPAVPLEGSAVAVAHLPDEGRGGFHDFVDVPLERGGLGPHVVGRQHGAGAPGALGAEVRLDDEARVLAEVVPCDRHALGLWHRVCVAVHVGYVDQAVQPGLGVIPRRGGDIDRQVEHAGRAPEPRGRQPHEERRREQFVHVEQPAARPARPGLDAVDAAAPVGCLDVRPGEERFPCGYRQDLAGLVPVGCGEPGAVHCRQVVEGVGASRVPGKRLEIALPSRFI